MHFLIYHKESNVCIMSLSLFQEFFWIPPKYSVQILYCICTIVTKIYLFNNHIIDVEWLDGKQETQARRGAPSHQASSHCQLAAVASIAQRDRVAENTRRRPTLRWQQLQWTCGSQCLCGAAAIGTSDGWHRCTLRQWDHPWYPYPQIWAAHTQQS